MFRPTLETLEKREVCAADLQPAAAALEQVPAELIVAEQIPALVAARDDDARVAALDAGSKEAAYLAQKAASQIASDGAFIDTLAVQAVLPYIEQDNLYKAMSYARTAVEAEAAHDEVFALLGNVEDGPFADKPQGIIAILIGLTADPKAGPVGSRGV